MGELSIADVFLILKPLCDSFIEKPDIKKAEKISKLIEKTPSFVVQKINENILYPITCHLKKNTFSKDDNLILINVIHAVIKKIKVQNLKLFFEIYHCLRIQICQEKNSMELIEVHEELKEIVILCLRDLFKSISNDIIESLYTRQNAAILSHGIYLSIKIARLEKSTCLRIAALECVMTTWQVHDEFDSSDIVLLNQIADVVMLYLPGVVSGLLEVALGSDIQNHKITQLAIRVWGRVLNLVMQDNFQEEITVPSIIMDTIRTKDPNDHEKMKHVLETAKRTPDWYSAVSEKFKIIFIELDNLTKNTHFKVRMELAESVCHLLLNCSRNMNSCFQIFLEILITLSEDDNSKVADKAREGLLKIQERCLQDKNMKTAIEVLEENLYELLTKMPRIIRTSGESVQIVWLNRLAGYLKVIGKQRLSRFLLSTAHLRKLLLTLVYITELDCSNISILEDTVVTNFDEIEYFGMTSGWKQFKFMYNTNSIEKLYNIFRILGEIEDKKMLVDCILKMTLELPKFQKELFLIVNTVIEVPMDPELKNIVCKQVVECYISADFWDLPLKVSDEVGLQVAQKNIVQYCILLEGLGKIAKVLQEDYQYFLLKTLYLIIEKSGSDQSLLRFIGLSTLKNIAESQKLDTIGDLFRINVDYISYHVTLKLRRVERNPGVLDVVNVVANYSTIDFLPHLKDIVDDLLLQSSSTMQKQNSESYLRVFYAFSMCIKRLTLSVSTEKKTNYCKDKIMNPAELIISNFLEFYEAKKDSCNYENNDECDNVENIRNLKEQEIDENNLNFDDDEKLQVPYYVKMIKSIMKRCLHYLPSQKFIESSLAMCILKEGVLILKNWEDELLPVVHELWHPLVDRFENSNPLIINQAWKLLCCLAKVSESFIRSRTLKQVLPAVSSFMKKSSKESFKKDTGSSYRYTQMFKLQKEILSQMGNFVKSLKLLEKDVWNILEITETYLHCQQNLELQACCVNMYQEISDYCPDIVWFKCVDIWHREVEPVEPQNNLSEWYSKVSKSSTKSNHDQNVLKILRFINDKRLNL